MAFIENDKRRISISFPDVVREFWPEDSGKKRKEKNHFSLGSKWDIKESEREQTCNIAK